MSLDIKLSKNWSNDKGICQVELMKLEVFRILLLCILMIDRSFRRSAYGFETVSVSIAALNLSLPICWVTQHNKIFSILFCCCLNWLNHVFLTRSQVACRCSELVWFFFQFTINLILTLHSETIKILLFVSLCLIFQNAMCNHDHHKKYWIDR